MIQSNLGENAKCSDQCSVLLDERKLETKQVVKEEAANCVSDDAP
jgi:hypothetical protein